MGILAKSLAKVKQYPGLSEIIKKVPDYAKDYKNEFLFIKGIDKRFEYYLKNLNKALIGVFQKRLRVLKNTWIG